MASCETGSTITATHRPLRRADVRIQELDGEALIFDPVSADTHRLNQTALFIWRQCDARQDTSQIARRLTEAYDVSHDRALQCVEHLLETLRKRRLIHEANQGTTQMQTQEGNAA